MFKHHSRLALGSMLLLGAGIAQAAPDHSTFIPVMQANGCTSCHAVNEKVVGPSFQSVAGLCCAIQSKGALPLTPDGFIPRAPSRACPAA